MLGRFEVPFQPRNPAPGLHHHRPGRSLSRHPIRWQVISRWGLTGLAGGRGRLAEQLVELGLDVEQGCDDPVL